MLIEWDETMAIGVHDIDEQHRLLLQMLNELHEKMSLGAAHQAVRDALQGMHAYASFHFADEERLLQEHGYPDLPAHRQAHQEFVQRLEDFQKVVEQDSLIGALEVLHFLKQWLVQHIKGTDKQFVPYLQGSPS